MMRWTDVKFLFLSGNNKIMLLFQELKIWH